VGFHGIELSRFPPPSHYRSAIWPRGTIAPSVDFGQMDGPPCPACGSRGLGQYIKARVNVGGKLVLMLGVSGWLPTDGDVEHDGATIRAYRLNSHAKANTAAGVMPRTSRRERAQPQQLMALPLVIECAFCRQWALVESPSGTR
jgi:hypothetical protein